MGNKKLAPSSGEVLAELGTDAAKWSAALADMLKTMMIDNESASIDGAPGSDLFGWVANMIEAGRSAGYAKGQEDLSTAADFFSNVDSDMRDTDKLTIFFVGGQAVGKTVVSKRLAETLAEFEIDSSRHVVKWPNGGEFDMLEIALDKDDLRTLATTKLGSIEEAERKGRDAARREGLNNADDIPVLSLADVNAIEFSVTTEEPGAATLTVDGIGRAILGRPNTVIVKVDGERYVLLRDAERLETPPSDARDGDRFEIGENASGSGSKA